MQYHYPNFVDLPKIKSATAQCSALSPPRHAPDESIDNIPLLNLYVYTQSSPLLLLRTAQYSYRRT